MAAFHHRRRPSAYHMRCLPGILGGSLQGRCLVAARFDQSACFKVRALSRLGHQVLVICGKPEGYSGLRRLEGAVNLLEVELPVWGRLDTRCAWQQFAAGTATPSIAAAVAAFGPDAVLGIDWHSLPAYEALATVLACQDGENGSGTAGLPPYIFMNYRVHLRTAEDDEARQLLAEMEGRALKLSACTTVLCRSDAEYLADAFPDVAPKATLHVLLPALRSDLASLPVPADVVQQGQQQQEQGVRNVCQQLTAVTSNTPTASTTSPLATEATAADAASAPPADAAPLAASPAVTGLVDSTHGRYLLTSAVRLAPEKEPHRFVDLAVELSRQGVLARAGVVPLMFGAGWDGEYGRELRARLKRELPECIVLDTFMGPHDLAAVYSATLLNVHPPLYEAYGLTVVEAASQGAPSLVNEGGHIGVTDLLDPSAGEVICQDLSRPIVQLAADVRALLAKGDGGFENGWCGREELRRVGVAAAAKARSWTEDANAKGLVEMIRDALGKSSSSAL